MAQPEKAMRKLANINMRNNILQRPLRLLMLLACATIRQVASAGVSSNEKQPTAPELIVQATRNEPNLVNISPDSKLLAAAGGGWGDLSIAIWDVEKGELLHLLRGHARRIYRLMFSTDGNMLASASEDKTIRIWNANTGALINVLNSKDVRYKTISFLDTGRSLASAGADGIVRVWNVQSGKLERSFKTPLRDSPNIVFLNQGEYLFENDAAGHKFWLYKVKEGKKIYSAAHDYQTGRSDIFGRTLIISYENEKDNQRIEFWDILSGKMSSVIPGAYVRTFSLTLRPGGDILAAVVQEDDEHEYVGLWNVRGGELLRKINIDNKRCNGLVFSPDGKILYIKHDKGTFIADAASGKILKNIVFKSWWWKDAFSPDGKFIALPYGINGIDILDARSGDLIKTLPGISSAYFSCGAAFYGNRIISQCFERPLSINLETGKVGFLRAPRNRTIKREYYGKRFIAEVYSDRVLILKHPITGRRLKSLLHSRRIMDVSFSDEDKTIGTYQCDFSNNKCAEGEVLIWDIASGKIIRSIKANSDYPYAPIFGAEGRLVAVGEQFSSIKVWNIDNGESVSDKKGPGISTLCGGPKFFSQDGSLLYDFGSPWFFSNFVKHLNIWNVHTGLLIRKLPADSFFSPIQQHAAFGGYSLGDSALSPDGKTLALGACGYTVDYKCQGTPISLIDTNTGKFIKGLRAPLSPDNYELRFIYHPSGKYLITGGYGGPSIINTETGKSIGNFERYQYGVTPLSVSPDGRVLLASSSEGALTLWNLETGKLLVMLYILQDGDWLAKDPGGRFDCSGCAARDSKRGMKYIRWSENGKLYPAEKYFDQFYRPGLIAEAVK